MLSAAAARARTSAKPDGCSGHVRVGHCTFLDHLEVTYTTHSAWLRILQEGCSVAESIVLTHQLACVPVCGIVHGNNHTIEVCVFQPISAHCIHRTWAVNVSSYKLTSYTLLCTLLIATAF